MTALLSARLLPLYIALALAITAGTVFGAVPLQIIDIVVAQFDPNTSPHASDLAFQQSILVELRLPRVWLGLTVGMALGVSGACFQALFKNPLADPGIVGVSAGAACGAITYIVLGHNWISHPTLSLPLFAMAGALTATALLFILSQNRLFFWQSKGNGGSTIMSTATLLLAGIAINALFNAINGVLIFFSDEQQLRELTFWSMGSLTRADNAYTLPAAAFVLASVLFNMRYANAINALSLGDNQAFFLGYNTARLKTVLLAMNTCAIGCVVALSGIIGFVGLVIPHISRMVFGANNLWVLPASALLGATALLLADVIARIVVQPAEMPIGVITGLVGSPFFIWLLINAGRN